MFTRVTWGRFCGLLVWVIFFLGISVGFSTAGAQLATATLNGTVFDEQDHPIPDADIKVAESSRGLERHFKTDAQGYFTASLLPPGTYQITAARPGFTTIEVSDVVLDVNDQRQIQLHLRVATVAETVTVESDAVGVTQQSSAIGTTIIRKFVQDLPLNGRNFQGLASLAPGAIPSSGARDSNVGGVSLSGTRSFDNSFLLDGADNSINAVEAITRVNVTVTPNLDAIQEFKILSSSYDAQFGNSVGGVINIISRSGTNDLHGTLYDYHRNAALNANTWQNNRSGIPKGHRLRNQFGGVLGGPVYLPKVYSGKNRTFFFFDYEEVREVLPPTFLNILVPDAKMRTGDFSEFLPGSADNPTGSTFVLGAPYVNNVLPSGSLDPVAQQLAALYPLPNLPGTLAFQETLPGRFNERKAGARIDHRFSEHDSIFGRYTYDSMSQENSTWSDLLAPGGVTSTVGYTIAATETHIFSPNLYNELQFSFSHSNPTRSFVAPNRDLYAEFGLTGIPPVEDTPTGQFRFQGLPGIAGMGHGAATVDFGIVRSYSDNLNWVKGKHSIRIGTVIRPQRMTDFEPQVPRGVFTFNDVNAVDGSGEPTNIGFAQFLTGTPSLAQFSIDNQIVYRNMNYAFYGQDTYRLTNSLTLNLGLRYEYHSPVTEIHDRQANFDTTTGVLIYPHTFNGNLPVSMAGIPVNFDGSSNLIGTDTDNWAPRIGFAYSFNPKTVVRGGYGIFYGFQEIGPWSFPSPGYNPPFNLAWNPTPQKLSNGYTLDPLNDPSTGFQIASMPTHLHTPRVSQWNVSVQRELGKDITFEANYSGSKGRDLYALIYFNQAVPGTSFADLNARQPFPYIEDTSQQSNNGGYSNYHALLLKTEMRNRHGLSYLVSYTYGHTLDNASDDDLGSSHAGDTFRDPRHMNWEYGNSDFDVRHRFVFSTSYDIPVGRGRTFAPKLGAFGEAFLGGWQVTGIFSAQTGNYFTAFGVNDSCFCNDGNSNSLRPDAVAGQNPNSGPRTVDQWFNVAAFDINVPDGSHGNAGRNTILGPGRVNLDAGLHKAFRFNERLSLEFRAEFFDAFNHPNWDKPVTDYNSANIGQIISSLTSREGQLALKLIY